MKLATVRRYVQAISFLLFLSLFFLTFYPLPLYLPVDFFVRLDPLAALVSMIAGRIIITTMLISAIVLASAAILGRFFCGYVCPLGILIDCTGSMVDKKKRVRESPDPKPNRKIKYLILAGVLCASAIGIDLLRFLSPLAITPRFFTLAVYPPVVQFVNGIIDFARPVFSNLGMDSLAQFTLAGSYFTGAILAAGTVAVILGMTLVRKRFWCRYVCPSGALISLVSRYGMIKRRVVDKTCNDCRRCAAACDMRAIDSNPRITILSECTLCGKCAEVCPKNSINFSLAGLGFGKQNGTLSVGRRGIFLGGVTGLFFGALVKAAPHTSRSTEGRFIRPPGALPEQEFLGRCIACGECMKVCKTNGLQPVIGEGGFNSFMSPVLKPRQGACEEKCNMCGVVCPTKAIRQLSIEEKSFAKIGTAVIDRHRCIAWEQDKLCLICDEICPYDAIEFKIVDNFTGPFKRPFVIEEKCVGCGWCENHCPVLGRAAIEIYSIGEERLRSGSYITEQKKKLRIANTSEAASYSASEIGSGGEQFKANPGTLPAQTTPSTNTGNSLEKKDQSNLPKLPPGFTP